MDGALAGEQVHRQQVDGGASPGLSPEGQGGGDGLHRLLGGHPRPEEVLQQLGRLGALLFGPGPEPMPSHRRRKSCPSSRRNHRPVSPLTFSPLPGAGQAGQGRKGSAWAKHSRSPAVSPSRRWVPRTSESSWRAARFSVPPRRAPPPGGDLPCRSRPPPRPGSCSAGSPPASPAGAGQG